MKNLYTTAALSILCLTTFAAHAGDIEVSSNVGFVSEYSFRGIAQSNENPALQGGFDASHESGIYAGVWGSNVNFNDGDEAHVEIDLYGGYSGSINNVSYDIGVIYYAYPGANTPRDYDFWEGSLALGYDFDVASVSASVNYSPDYFNESGDSQYYALNADVPLPADFTLSGHLGYQVLDDETTFGLAAGEDTYTDWSLGLGYSYEGFDLSLQYVDTNLDEPSECGDGCAERIIFGVSRSF